MTNTKFKKNSNVKRKVKPVQNQITHKLNHRRLNHWKFPNVVLFCFLIVIFLLYIRFCFLALSNNVDGINLREFAEARNTVTETLFAKRGTIYDKEGDILAHTVTSYNLYAYIDEKRTTDINDPKHVVDKEKTAEILAEILQCDYNYILGRLNADAKVVYFGTCGSNITELTKLKIDTYNLAGLGFDKTNMRYYPNGNFASYILGYAKKELIDTLDNTKIVGKLGIEATYDEILSGTDGYYRYQRDKYNNKIPNTPETKVEAIDGLNIYLTLDSAIQRFAESAMNELMNEYSPEWGIIAVMDAHSGEILASATSPSYDPNSIPTDMSYQNPLVSYTYEPGSTMKIYTYMCAIDKGNYDGSKQYLSGTFNLSDTEAIHDWNTKGWGYLSYDTGFSYSSNVAIANIIQEYLEVDDLQNCLEKYGFGEKTGVELSNEAKGDIDYYYKIELYAAGFGQGISITAIQQLQALSIIANNGKMVKPHIISKIVNSNTGEEIITEPIYSDQLVKESTVAKIKELMKSVASPGSPTGAKYYMEGYDIIAKTGTAQIYENGQYTLNANDYIVSVGLMFPGYDPQYIIYAVAKRPAKSSGSALVSPVQGLIKNIAKYKDIFTPTTVESNVNSYITDSYYNKSVDEVVNLLHNHFINIVVLGDGNKVIDQYPKQGIELVSNDKVFLLTNGSTILMPDITGFSRIEVVEMCNLLNLNCKFNGYGYVSSQSIQQGSPISSYLEVNLNGH